MLDIRFSITEIIQKKHISDLNTPERSHTVPRKTLVKSRFANIKNMQSSAGFEPMTCETQHPSG